MYSCAGGVEEVPEARSGVEVVVVVVVRWWSRIDSGDADGFLDVGFGVVGWSGCHSEFVFLCVLEAIHDTKGKENDEVATGAYR